MKKQILVLVSPALFVACGMFSTYEAPPPSPDLNDHLQNSQWKIQSVDLAFKNFRGTCDLSKAHPNSIQETSDNSQIYGILIQKLHESDPDACHFEVSQSGSGFSPASHFGGAFEIQVKSVSTVSFKYHVGSVMPVKSPEDKTSYLNSGWITVFNHERMPASETPYMMKKQNLGDSKPVVAQCTKFETNGRISLRKKVATCYLPDNQGTIRLEEVF